MPRDITPTILARKRVEGEDREVIDVRTPVEFREVHVDGARNVPLDTLTPDTCRHLESGKPGSTLYLICKTGARAKQAAARLEGVGVEDVCLVEGGIDAWVEAGLDVERGKKAVSLERQVRIAAGTLVLLGSVLAFLVHPYFVAIPAFVGAGLIFAGVTDTCGMGMLLARMPWNKERAIEQGRPSEGDRGACRE